VSAVDLHPEELLDRARRGEASPEERQRLRAHLAACPACRFEHVLAADGARAAATTAEDAQVLARARRGAARALHQRRALATRASSWTRRRPTRLVFAAAALVIFAATFAAATTVVRHVMRGPELEPVEAARVARAHRRVASASAEAAPAALAPDDNAQDDGLADSDSAVVEAPKAAPARAPRARQVASADSPGELFARANAARRAGQTREASRLYRELQREFPGSSEELVSRVTLGRWMLDRLDDPSGALARFDSYLANPVHTALREEALIGRALALGKLGRTSEERGAWTAFLAAFPGSVYAERARGRLEALR
jgi:putative zinc finger protein